MKKLLACLLLFLGALWWVHAETDPFLRASPLVVMDEPAQAPTDMGAFDFADYGFFPRTFRIRPLAAYDVKGRVLHKRRYFSDKFQGDLIPFDLGLGWRHMSDKVVLGAFLFDHRADAGGGRFLWMNWRLDKNGRPYPLPAGMGEPMAQLSNNHVIPATKKVFRQLGAIEVGDVVRLKGYLVKITDPQRAGWEWTSSLTRTDTSTHWGGNNTSCESVFVTDVETVQSVDPLRTAPAPEWFWPR